eukprot:TRINITY_DN57730_c0_g1_i1.p1 TRINITY_DN57730_c0_g1~~TRINITY_DN57730_c0_g1_i1.p1  ORF type:complete len:170 (+),score=75.38 TRINITY_DN57730_c0_g1_i1:94-603(+)
MSVSLVDDVREDRQLDEDPALLGMGLDAKVVRYENLIEESLRPRLEAVVLKRDKVYEDIGEGTKLKHFIERQLLSRQGVDGPLMTMVDLGHHFYARTEVEDPNSIMVDIGLGLYVKYTPQEALSHLARRETLLEQRCASLTEEASRIKVEIKVVYDAIAALADADQPEA